MNIYKDLTWYHTPLPTIDRAAQEESGTPPRLPVRETPTETTRTRNRLTAVRRSKLVRKYGHLKLDLTAILSICALHFEIDMQEIKGRSRNGNIVLARHCFCWLAYHFTERPVEEIGDYLEQRDRLTVMWSVNLVEDSANGKTGYVDSDIAILKFTLFSPGIKHTKH